MMLSCRRLGYPGPNMYNVYQWNSNAWCCQLINYYFCCYNIDNRKTFRCAYNDSEKDSCKEWLTSYIPNKGKRYHLHQRVDLHLNWIEIAKTFNFRLHFLHNNKDIITHPLHTLEHDTVVRWLPSLAYRIQRTIELAFSFHATAATLTLDDLHLVFLQNTHKI